MRAPLANASPDASARGAVQAQHDTIITQSTCRMFRFVTPRTGGLTETPGQTHCVSADRMELNSSQEHQKGWKTGESEEEAKSIGEFA